MEASIRAIIRKMLINNIRLCLWRGHRARELNRIYWFPEIRSIFKKSNYAKSL